MDFILECKRFMVTKYVKLADINHNLSLNKPNVTNGSWRNSSWNINLGSGVVLTRLIQVNHLSDTKNHLGRLSNFITKCTRLNCIASSVMVLVIEIRIGL